MNPTPPDGDRLAGVSPVPEWFGKSDDRSAIAARSGSPFGCLLVLLSLAVGGAGIFYGVSSDARVKKAQRERDRCEAEKATSLREYQLGRRMAAQPCPTPSVAVPAPAATATAEPTDTEEVSPPREGTLSSSDVADVTRKLNPAFRRCYDQALAENPNAEARVQLGLTIDPSGKVTSAQATGPGGATGLPTYAYRCLEAVAKTARFPTATQKTTVTLPIVFRSQ